MNKTSIESIVNSIDSKICDLAESVRCVKGRMSLGSLFKMLAELDGSRGWKSLESIWGKNGFNPLWRMAHPDEDWSSVDGIAETVSFDSVEWGVHFDVTVLPDKKQGCCATVRWSSDGKMHSESEFENRVWIWENLNSVSRYFIGRAVARNACGSRSCFEDWTFLPE